MSILGAHKTKITKAAKVLRNKITELDKAILEPLDFTVEAGKNPQLVLSRKSLLFYHFTTLGRAVDSLRTQREKAEEFARQHPDENGEFPFLQQIQDHWEANELDELVEEAETLRDRIDAVIKLLPSSEALCYFRTSTVPPSLCNFTPNPTQDPTCSHQPAQDVRMEVASHSSSREQDRPADPDAVAPAVQVPPSARASSVVQGFDNPSHDPSSHPTFAHPPSAFDQSNPFASYLAPNTNPSLPMEQSLKLPTFEIPTFHGDVDNFPEFWDLFSTAVHNNTSVPASLKFMYLKSHLRGPAASIIAGFQSTAENYEDAVRTLTNTYGRPEILRNRLWDKLMQLSPASDSPLSQRATLCTIKAIWSQLKHLKEDSSAIGTLKIIRAKFPRRTREKIGEHKLKGDSMWTVDELLSTLDIIIDRLESIEDADPLDHHSYNSQAAVRQDSLSPRRYPSASRTDPAFTRYRTSSYYPRRPSVSRTPSPYSRPDRSLTPYYTRTTSRSPSRARYAVLLEPYCAFCRNSGHPSERCNIVQDVAQRRSFLARYRLCWLCLQQGHGYAQCDAPSCEYCGKVHHRALCWNLPRAQRSPPSRRTMCFSPSRSYSPRRVQFQKDAQGFPYHARGDLRAPSPRSFHSQSPATSGRQSFSSPTRRASPARRSQSPTSAVHSATCTPDLSRTTMDAQPEPLDQHQARSGSHSPSPCLSVCSQDSAHQEPRLMVVHALTKNHKTDTNELLTVFLDSGSQYSFICTSIAKHLGLPFRNTRTITTLTFGGHQFTEESSEVTLVLWDQYSNPIHLELWTRETITTVPRTKSQNDSDIVDYADRVEVDVLIGIDNYWRIVDLHRNEKLPSGLTLSHTRFGPVVSGLKYPVVSNTLLATRTLFTDDETTSEQLVRSLFGLDTIAMEEQENAQDANVIKHFYDTVRIIDGSIYVSFPWKSHHPPLADNKALAFRRLQNQYEKFRTTPSVWDEYCKIFDHQLRTGIIEDVTNVAARGPNVYYIPHQAVYKQGNTTTKLRIVLDASSHQKGAPSLNDCLHQGPSLLPDLVGTLMRSRFHCYLIIADVEKAFHQIHLHQDQRDATRFLWLKDVHHPPSSENLRIMRFARLPFGINASPFLLSMSIRYFLEQYPANRLKEEILANTYVDNVIVGAKTTQECVDKCRECKDIFSRMHMNLREFMSNNQRALATITQESCMTLQGPFANFLGVKWNPMLDVLHVPLNIARQPVTSKRTALQVYASTFDPLGLLTPLLIRPKMFIQDLWESGYDWDAALSDEVTQKWSTIVQDMSGFHLSVPRFIGVTFDDTYDMVVCSDASKRVYAVAVYIVTRPHQGTPRSTLLFAKAKLAPPGAITIPRMELLGCHMAVKTVRFLKSQLKVRFHSITFLTDSQIVLYWIQSNKPLRTYVINRVNYIRRVLDELKAEKIATGFYYLATESNPADCATRGLTASELEHHIWWTGPSFFTTPFRQWPCKSFQPSHPVPAGADSEELPVPRAVVTSVCNMLETYRSFVPFTRTNSYAKLACITAYVLKYVAKLRHRAKTRKQCAGQDERFPFNTMDITSTITSHDYTAAELVLIREHYREIQHQLDSSYVKKLHTTREIDGTIRVDLRMANAQMSDTTRNPILIVSSHPLCDKIIAHYHYQLLHAGPSHLITALRERFFIPRLRRFVKSFISRCVTCKKYQSRALTHPRALDLPAEREDVCAKSYFSVRSPRVGEVVLIKQDATRSNWPLGLILEVHTSPDGKIRSARLRTGKRRIVERAISDLLSLEVVAEDAENPERNCRYRAKAKRRHCGVSRT